MKTKEDQVTSENTRTALLQLTGQFYYESHIVLLIPYNFNFFLFSLYLIILNLCIFLRILIEKYGIYLKDFPL